MLRRIVTQCTAWAAVALLPISCAQQSPSAGTAVPARWQILEPALLELGSDDGDDHAIFHRVAAVHRNSRGDVFVADGSREIRVFDRSGALLRRFGGPGGGPGEFSTIQKLQPLSGDTLYALDGFAARATILTEDGAVVRTLWLRSGPSPWLAKVAAGYVAGTSRPPLAFPVGSRAFEYARFLLLAEDGDTIRTLATLPVRDMYRVQAPAGTRTTTVPFDPHGQFAFGSDSWYFAWPAEWTITRYRYEPDSAVDTIRVDRPLRRLEPSAIEQWIDARLATTPPHELAALRRYWRAFPYRETLPAFDRMLLDEEENLWVREYVIAGDAAATWVILAADGRVLAELQTPPDLQLMHVGRDVAVGVRRDEYDREYIVAYELRREPAATIAP
jgi:hypothetical protein